MADKSSGRKIVIRLRKSGLNFVFVALVNSLRERKWAHVSCLVAGLLVLGWQVVIWSRGSLGLSSLSFLSRALFPAGVGFCLLSAAALARREFVFVLADRRATEERKEAEEKQEVDTESTSVRIIRVLTLPILAWIKFWADGHRQDNKNLDKALRKLGRPIPPPLDTTTLGKPSRRLVPSAKPYEIEFSRDRSDEENLVADQGRLRVASTVVVTPRSTRTVLVTAAKSSWENSTV